MCCDCNTCIVRSFLKCCTLHYYVQLFSWLVRSVLWQNSFIDSQKYVLLLLWEVILLNVTFRRITSTNVHQLVEENLSGDVRWKVSFLFELLRIRENYYFLVISFKKKLNFVFDLIHIYFNNYIFSFQCIVCYISILYFLLLYCILILYTIKMSK